MLLLGVITPVHSQGVGHTSRAPQHGLALVCQGSGLTVQWEGMWRAACDHRGKGGSLSHWGVQREGVAFWGQPGARLRSGGSLEPACGLGTTWSPPAVRGAAWSPPAGEAQGQPGARLRSGGSLEPTCGGGPGCGEWVEAFPAEGQQQSPRVQCLLRAVSGGLGTPSEKPWCPWFFSTWLTGRPLASGLYLTVRLVFRAPDVAATPA